MKHRVIYDFIDKFDKTVRYRVGDTVDFDDESRISDLISRGLIEKSTSLEDLTKADLIALLGEKGVECDSKATKADLIALLGGE